MSYDQVELVESQSCAAHNVTAISKTGKVSYLI
jgi:hypothetical protein